MEAVLNTGPVVMEEAGLEHRPGGEEHLLPLQRT